MHMFNAIRQALAWLTFDELPDDERPPRKIWLNGDKMTEWFAAVKRRREEKYGLSSDGKISDEPIHGPTSQNDTRALLGLR